MTTAIRQLECQDTAATLPTDALAWQNQANAEVAALWRYIAAPLTSISGTNAVTASSDSSVVGPITGYQKGQKFSLIPVSTNTGGMTINIDGVGVKTMVNADSTTIQGGTVVANTILLIEYDATNFRIMASGSSASGLPSTAPDMILQDQKSQNTPGGTSTLGSFQTRTLNTAARNNIAGASLSNNQFTLPAGNFFVMWSAPAFEVGAHQTRLQDVTGTPTTIAIGSSSSAATGSADTTLSRGSAYFTLSTAKIFEIQHRSASTQASNGFGLQANFGTELYTEVLIWKVGQLASQVNGVPGGAVTFPLIIDTTSTADSDPGAGKMRFNNATQNTATVLRVDLADANGTDITALLDTLDASTSAVEGAIRLVKYDDPTVWMTFNLTARAAPSGYRNFTVSNTAAISASPFANGDRVFFAFSRTGDKGATGAQGSDAGNIPWLFSTSTTMADPSAGNLRFNNATLASATSLAISANSAASGNPTVHDWVAAWDDFGNTTARGYLIIRKTSAPQNFAIYKITGTITDNTTWLQVTVAFVAGAGSFSNTDGLSVDFAPASPPVSAPVLLETLTASNSATLPTTVTWDNTYSFFDIVFDQVVPATNATAGRWQVHSGGSFQTATYLTCSTAAATGATTNVALTSGIPIAGDTTQTIASNGNFGFSGTMRVSNVADTGHRKMFRGQGTFINGVTGTLVNQLSGGAWDGGNGAIDGGRFLFASGNISSGTIKIYGIP